MKEYRVVILFPTSQFSTSGLHQDKANVSFLFSYKMAQNGEKSQMESYLYLKERDWKKSLRESELLWTGHDK